MQDFPEPGKPTEKGFIKERIRMPRSDYSSDLWRMCFADARKGWRIGAETPTKTDPAVQSGIKSRLHRSIQMASPARRLEESWEIQRPATESQGQTT